MQLAGARHATFLCPRLSGATFFKVAFDDVVTCLSQSQGEGRAAHLRFIVRQPCTVCGRQPCEAHHIRFGQQRALSRKVSDEFTVPLCRAHHRELHGTGDERSWWNRVNIDPMPIARRFWQHTQGVLPIASFDPNLQGRDTDVVTEEQGKGEVDALEKSPSVRADVSGSEIR